MIIIEIHIEQKTGRMRVDMTTDGFPTATENEQVKAIAIVEAVKQVIDGFGRECPKVIAMERELPERD